MLLEIEEVEKNSKVISSIFNLTEKMRVNLFPSGELAFRHEWKIARAELILSHHEQEVEGMREEKCYKFCEKELGK
jgi:hypothetical protein